MKNKANFGSRSIGSGFGSPPTNSTTSLGDEKCYTVLRTETLVLDFNAGIAIGCKYNIRSYDQIKITSKQEMEQCNDDTCKTTQNTVISGPTQVDGGVPSTPVPNGKTACELLKALEKDEDDFHIQIQAVTTFIGCSKAMKKMLRWPGALVGAGGILINIGNDLPCGIGPTPGGREDLFKKILKCLCEIEKEADPDKKKKKMDELLKKIGECAAKFNKKMVDGPGGIKRGEKVLGENGFSLPLSVPFFKSKKEHISDLLTELYEACLSRIEKLC